MKWQSCSACCLDRSQIGLSEVSGSVSIDVHCIVDGAHILIVNDRWRVESLCAL